MDLPHIHQIHCIVSKNLKTIDSAVSEYISSLIAANVELIQDGDLQSLIGELLISYEAAEDEKEASRICEVLLVQLRTKCGFRTPTPQQTTTSRLLPIGTPCLAYCKEMKTHLPAVVVDHTSQEADAGAGAGAAAAAAAGDTNKPSSSSILYRVMFVDNGEEATVQPLLVKKDEDACVLFDSPVRLADQLGHDDSKQDDDFVEVKEHKKTSHGKKTTYRSSSSSSSSSSTFVDRSDLVYNDSTTRRAEIASQSALCELCQRSMPLTRHHLIPKTTWPEQRRKKSVDHTVLHQTVAICRPCHSAVHRAHDEKTLAQDFNTLELLLNDPALQSWMAYAKKQRPRKEGHGMKGIRYRR